MVSESYIHTDEYGRIEVQVHYDRRGIRDEESSCFIRVARNWAGPKWGSIFSAEFKLMGGRVMVKGLPIELN